MDRKRLQRLHWGVLVALAFAAGSAHAVLKDVGPPDPAHGFPKWYRDASTTDPGFPAGLPLEPCLSGVASPAGPMCVLLADPGYNPALPIVFPTNFPSEFFYTIVDQVFAYPAGTAKVRIALEGAFGGGVPLAGDQVAFARLRVVIDAPLAGTYTITHPYGVETQTAATAGNRAIVFTRDVGLAPGIFTGALLGDVGPFLTCAAGPVTIGAEQFVGDPNVPCAATGSPFATNYIQIVGPPGADLGGPAGTPNVVTANLLSISGKIYPSVIRAPLVGRRATYGRDVANTYIDVFADADPLANVAGAVPSSLQVSGTGLPTTAMSGDGLGGFFAHLPLANPVALPATVRVTNVADVPPSFVDVPLADDVAITLASYDPTSQAVTIQASSRDTLVPPTLSYGATPLAAGSLTVTAVASPPPSVTVTSSGGGADTEPVRVVPGPVSSVKITTVPPPAGGAAVTFTGAAAGGSGTYEYRFWHRSAAAGGVWSIVQDYSRTPSWIWNSASAPAGTYYVEVDARNAGSRSLREAAATTLYNSAAPTAVNFLSIAPPSPSPLPRPVSIGFTAQGVGGSGTYEYQFWVRSAAAGSTWSLAQPYGAGATFTWPVAGLAAGNYYVEVDCRAAGSASPREVSKVVPYTLQ